MSKSVAKQIFSSDAGTVPFEADELPSTGYLVGGIVSALILESDEVGTREGRGMVEAFLTYLADRIRPAFIGWWTDEETGKLWVDAVSWHADEFEAARIGNDRLQIAIYDIARGESIRLP